MRRRQFFSVLGGAAALTLVTALSLCGACLAQSTDPALVPQPDRELVIGTKEAPPFAMKAADGSWQGISIDLWRRIADEKKWRYRFVEVQTVPELIDGVTTSKFDVAVAALTVTPARERTLDFTASFSRPDLVLRSRSADRRVGGRWSPR